MGEPRWGIAIVAEESFESYDQGVVVRIHKCSA